MKKCLISLSLLILTLACFSQTQVIVKVSNLAAVQTYTGTANRLYDSTGNVDYILCPLCTVDGVNVFSGVLTKKWLKTWRFSGGTGSNDPDSLGGKAAADYEIKANKKTTLTNSTTDYASTSAITTALGSKLNSTDTAAINAEIVQLRSSVLLKLNTGDTAAMLSSYSTKINKNIDSINAHNTRILNEAVDRDNADIKTIAVTGTTTKTITLTKGDASTITATFTDATGGSSPTTFDGTQDATEGQTSFTFSTSNPTSATDAIVFIDGQKLKTTQYSFSGTTTTIIMLTGGMHLGDYITLHKTQ